MGDEREVSCVAGHHPTSHVDRFLAHGGEFGHSGYISSSGNLVPSFGKCFDSMGSEAKWCKCSLSGYYTYISMI